MVTKRRRTDEVDESVNSVQTEMTPQTMMRKEEQRQGFRRSGSKPWLEEGETAWRKAGERYGVERVAAEELSMRKRAETRRKVEGLWAVKRLSKFERRARAAAKKSDKELGLSAIQQIREAHPKRSSEKELFDLREQLSQRNESWNEANNAHFFRREEERPAVVERPLTSSTPGPQQKTPGMNLADIIKGH